MQPANTILSNNTQFTREDTKAIKGIAVLLMLFHHLATYSGRFPTDFQGFQFLLGSKYLSDIADSAKFCVSIFFFLGGYGLFIKFKNQKLSITDTILGLYKSYWKVFLVFIPIAFVFFRRGGDNTQPLATIYAFSRIQDYVLVTLSNFIGWSCELNAEWWFFKSYLCVIPIGYLFCLATKKNNNFWIDIFLVLGLDILFNNVFPALVCTEIFNPLRQNIYFSNFLLNESRSIVFFAGIVFAKYDGICKIKERITQTSFYVPLCLFILIGLILVNLYVIQRSETDIIYCALSIPAISALLDRFLSVKNIMTHLGKHSTNMWLIHSFYCYYFLEFTKIVYCTQNVWIDFAILVALSLVSSILVNAFWKFIGQLYAKCRSSNLQS